MSLLDEFYAAHGAYGWKCKILTGRDGLRLFLRHHQNARYPHPALHYRDVNDLMICGHVLLGLHAPDGRLAGAGVVLFPDRPMPLRARFKDALVAKTCAVLAFAETARDAPAYERSLLRQMLLPAACDIAARNGRARLLENYRGPASPGIVWDTHARAVLKAPIVTVAEQKILAVG